MQDQRTRRQGGQPLRRRPPAQASTDPQTVKAAIRFWTELAEWTNDARLAESLRAGADELAATWSLEPHVATVAS